MAGRISCIVGAKTNCGAANSELEYRLHLDRTTSVHGIDLAGHDIVHRSISLPI